MNFRNSVSVVSGAVLLAGLGIQQANAQTYSSTTVDYGLTTSVLSATDTTGGDPLDGLTLTALSSATAYQIGSGSIIDPLTGVSITTPGLGSVTGGTGDLMITNGVASFTLVGGTYVPAAAGETLTDFDFTFTPSGVSFVGGGTSVTAGGVTVTYGSLSDFTGSASITNLSLYNPGTGVGTPPPTFVPEPGTVSLLAGLAVVGSSFGLRRRRRAA